MTDFQYKQILLIKKLFCQGMEAKGGRSTGVRNTPDLCGQKVQLVLSVQSTQNSFT